MAILAAELITYGAASRPEDDVSTTGGAIDAAARPLDSQWAANAVAAAISDGADTRTLTITGRLADGTVDTEALVLTGAVEVVGAKTWERILKAVLSVADGARTVTLRQGAGGTTRHTFNPNETDAFIMFQRSASEAAQTIRYEKTFVKNTNGTLALQSAEVELTADPSLNFEIAVAGAVDDTESVANRETAPTGETFVDDNVAQSVPGGSLAAGSAIGVWSKMTLAADAAASKTSHTIQVAGTST